MSEHLCFFCHRKNATVLVGGLWAHRDCIYSLGVIEAGKRARKIRRELGLKAEKP